MDGMGQATKTTISTVAFSLFSLLFVPFWRFSSSEMSGFEYLPVACSLNSFRTTVRSFTAVELKRFRLCYSQYCGPHWS